MFIKMFFIPIPNIHLFLVKGRKKISIYNMKKSIHMNIIKVKNKT